MLKLIFYRAIFNRDNEYYGTKIKQLIQDRSLKMEIFEILYLHNNLQLQ